MLVSFFKNMFYTLITWSLKAIKDYKPVKPKCGLFNTGIRSKYLNDKNEISKSKDKAKHEKKV